MDDYNIYNHNIENLGLREEPQNSDMIRFLNFLHPNGEVYELCAFLRNHGKSELWGNEWISKSDSRVNGWFEDHKKAAYIAKRLDDEVQPKAIYVTVNPCSKDLLARTKNRLLPAKLRTSDNEIERISNLFIDIDPVRPSNIPSTEEEHALAFSTAHEVRDFLLAEGWPEPAVLDSGNGAYLIYKTDLENSTENVELIRSLLQLLAQRFNGAIEIDEAVHNPSRLIRLIGTVNRKGDGTDERPHRQSKIISIPETIEPVALSLLETLIQKHRIKPEPVLVDCPSERRIENNVTKKESNLDVKAYLEHYNRSILKVKKEDQGTIYCLEQCVFDPGHTENEASIIVNDKGVVHYKCFHNSCQKRTWKEAREIISGKDSLEPFLRHPMTRPLNIHPKKSIEIISAAELLQKTFTPLQYLVEGIIPPGLTLLAGKPKTRKSFMALNIAAAIATGNNVFGPIPVPQGKVVYFALEDTERRIYERLGLLGVPANCKDLTFSYSCPGLDEGAQEALAAFIESQGPVKLIIIDTLARVLPRKQGRDIYRENYTAIATLKEVADSYDVPFVVIHHTRKAHADDPVDEVLGTTGYTGAADTILIIKRSRGYDDAELLVTGRDIVENNFGMTFSNGIWTLAGDGESYNWNMNYKEIVDLIKTAGGRMSSGEISNHFLTLGEAPSTIRTRLRVMEQRGLLMNSERGIYEVVPTNNANKTNIPTKPTTQQDVCWNVGNVDYVCHTVDQTQLEDDLLDGEYPDELHHHQSLFPELPTTEASPSNRCLDCIHYISHGSDPDEDIFHITGCEMDLLNYEAPERSCRHFEMMTCQSKDLQKSS